MSGTEWDPAGPPHYEPTAAEPAPEPAAAEPAYPHEGQFVPGLAGPGPALQYLDDRRRRRGRQFTLAASAVIAIVIIAAVLAVALPGGHHGQSGVRLTAAQVVASAARREAALRSYSVSYTEQISGSAAATIAGTIKVQRSPLKMAMKLAVSSGGHSFPISAIVTGKAMYLKLTGLPGLPAAIAAKWLKIPLIGPGGTSPLASIEQEIQSENPLTQTAMFISAEHLRAAGKQVVDGVTTTKYTGRVTPANVVKSMPAAERTQLGPYLRLLKGTVPISIWIDAHGNIRKSVVTERVGTDTVVVAFTMAALNQPVKISVPPASKVYTVPQSDLGTGA